MAKLTTHQAYGIAAVLATVAAILQLADRDWFDGAVGLVLASTMTLAATGFPERSGVNKRLYYGVLGVLIVLLSIKILVHLMR
jgi:hypothetical protein